MERVMARINSPLVPSNVSEHAVPTVSYSIVRVAFRYHVAYLKPIDHVAVKYNMSAYWEL